MPLAPPPLSKAELSGLLEKTKAIPGWLNVSEQSVLYSLGKVTPGPILELGCFKGKSTSCFLIARQAARFSTTHVVVDLFKDHLDVGRGDFEADFRNNVKPWLGHTDLKVLRMSTFDVAPVLPETLGSSAAFSGIFVDADHSYDSVLKDGRLAHEMLCPGGWIAFHDAIRWEGTTTVLPACLDIPELGEYGFLGIHSSILLLQKPSPQERFTSWKHTPKIKAYAAWGRSPFARLLSKGTGLVMGSRLGKVFSKGRSLLQKLSAPDA